VMTDEALLLDIRTGSRAALEELFARYRNPLFGFFRRRLESRERAQDLTQETFLAVMRGASKYEPRASARTYLYGIAVKLIAAERRKQAKLAVWPKGAPEQSVEPSPDAALWVREALDRLEPQEREIVMLREYEQLSYEEIAEVLRIPVNTVRSRLFRARMALKDRLEPAPRPEPAPNCDSAPKCESSTKTELEARV
jgi:RNA polymerase sigma-70 factor, ECF subfamily